MGLKAPRRDLPYLQVLTNLGGLLVTNLIAVAIAKGI